MIGCWLTGMVCSSIDELVVGPELVVVVLD